MLHFFIFTYFLAAHLLADFLFQPDSLLAWKHKNWKGIFVHALILFVTSLVFFWPFMAKFNLLGVGLLFLNAILHFFIDQQKIRMEKKEKKFVRLFVFDQFLHLVVLGVLTALLANLIQNDLFLFGKILPYFTDYLPFVLYLILAVLITYVYEILQYQFRRQKGYKGIKFNYQNMFVRLMFLSLLFGFVMFLGGYRIAHTLLG